MYRFAMAGAALLLAGWMSTSPADTLARADEDWDKGDYVAALTAYQQLLNGTDAAALVEPIARRTGELFRTRELTADGANPVLAADSRHFSFETGSGVSAGIASGVGRVTHVRATAAPGTDLTALDGGDASFCPDGRRVAFLRVPASPDVNAAQAAVARAATTAERAPRQQQLARLVARTGRIFVRDLVSGRDEAIDTGDLLKTGVTCGADGVVFFAGAAERDATATQIYAGRAGAAPEAMTSGDGFKVPSKVDAAGRTVLFLVPRQGPFRTGSAPGAGARGAGVPPATDPASPTDPPDPVAGGGAGGGGGGGGRGNVATAFGVVSPGGKAAIVNGLSPALSRDGRFVTWLVRPAPNDQRIVAAASDNLAGATDVRKGPERIDAPAIGPDGALIAFQITARDDSEIYVIGRDGKNERRITRDIQHDVAPQFLGPDRVLGMIGEPRHRRSYLYDLTGTAPPAATRTQIFHNNTVRTIAPEYVWVPSGDGTKVLIVAERDGDTVSPERGVYLVDLASRVTLDEVKARMAADLKSEIALRDAGQRMFAPIADAVRTVTSAASVSRVYAHEKALFDFDSKHISRPGNTLASEYLFNAYRSFGYTPEYQWFSPRNAPGGQTANVVATLKGTANPELVYVVSSHYDSVAGGPGADDDSSGTAALLETARMLAGHPMPATIVFASFTGEEAGLLGSREFVRRAVEARTKIVGALNNDMIGWANDHRLDNTIRYSNRGIRDVQHAAAMQFSRLITYDALYYKGTDAASYYDAYGDIVGGIGSYPVLGNPHYHQPHDLLDGINHQLVTETAKTTAATLMLLASSPSRINGLTATSSSASWTPSPESGITGYIVSWGPEDAPKTLRVTQPKATLPNVPSGTAVRVKAVNGRGLEGWDWARTTVK
jgi:Peptidase family M28